MSPKVYGRCSHGLQRYRRNAIDDGAGTKQINWTTVLKAVPIKTSWNDMVYEKYTIWFLKVLHT